MAKCDVKLRSLVSDDKFQGKIFFELTLRASNSSLRERSSGGPTVPASFVQKHGDKFRESVMLQTESATKPWPVKLNIWNYSPLGHQVRLSGGWRAFAISNGLLEGDALTFVLTAVSKFKVYILRGMKRPHQILSPEQTTTACDSDRALSTAKKPETDCKDERSGGDGEGSAGGSNGQISLQRKYGAAHDSAFDSGSSLSCRRDILHYLPAFKKTLTAANIGTNGSSGLEFPGPFCRMYGNRIHAVVQLQGIHESSPVRISACVTDFGRDIRHFLRSGWGAFVAENQLREGLQLLFTLSAESFFVVRMISGNSTGCEEDSPSRF